MHGAGFRRLFCDLMTHYATSFGYDMSKTTGLSYASSDCLGIDVRHKTGDEGGEIPVFMAFTLNIGLALARVRAFLNRSMIQHKKILGY